MCRNPTFGKIRNKSIKDVFQPEDSRSRKEKSRRPTGGPHLAQARAYPWPRLGVVWPLRVAPGPPLRAIYSLRPKNSGNRLRFREKVPLRRRHSETSNRDQKSSFWHAAGTGN